MNAELTLQQLASGGRPVLSHTLAVQVTPECPDPANFRVRPTFKPAGQLDINQLLSADTSAVVPCPFVNPNSVSAVEWTDCIASLGLSGPTVFDQCAIDPPHR